MSSDPTTWGIQPNGWVTPSAADILERIELDEKAYIRADIDVEADAPVGQINGIVAAQLGLAWEALGALEASRSRDGAEGAMLDELGKLTGSSRAVARATTVPCNVTLDAGTTLTVDNLASVAGKPEVTFYPVVDETSGFTAPTTGVHVITWRCTETGAVLVTPGTLTVITTPVSGWTAITNPTAGTIGGDSATDAQARLEQLEDLTATGSSTAAAIAADLPYDPATGVGVPGVLEAEALENYTDAVNIDGLPPHSIEAVLYTDGTEDVNAIAEAIFKAKPAGCTTYGTSSGTYTDERGDVHTVNYSVIGTVRTYLKFTLSKGSDYAGDTAVKAYVANTLNARYGVGADVIAVYVQALPMQLTGVLDVTAFTLGTVSPPVGATNISIGVRQRATFDPADITVL